LREKMKQRSSEQSKRFSWDSSARRIFQVYEEVVGGRWSEKGSRERGEKLVNS